MSIAYFCGTDLTSGNYVPLKKLQMPLEILQRIPGAYVKFVNALFVSITILPKSVFYSMSIFINVLNCVLLLLSIWIVINTIVVHKIKVLNIFFISILFFRL